MFIIAENLALVQTVDFFPPIVDDPYYFGQIAAANALSDVFAMGGRPLTALNIIGFPLGSMPTSVFTEILKGGSEKIEESGAVVVGGHSIKDSELKYGVAITGLVDPRRVVSNAGARPGDKLFLTKPLGTGLITTGIKRNAVDEELIETVITQMAALNKTAADLMLAHDVHAATDITGYGLLGHAYEMAAASGVTIRIFAESLPLLPRVRELVERQMIPAGAGDNREYMTGKAHVADSLDKRLAAVLFDPQTSGGLFIAIPSDRADEFSQALAKNGLPEKVVGAVEPPGEYPIVVR